MTSALAATALPLFRPPFPDGSRAFLTALFRVDSASWRPRRFTRIRLDCSPLQLRFCHRLPTRLCCRLAPSLCFCRVYVCLRFYLCLLTPTIYVYVHPAFIPACLSLTIGPVYASLCYQSWLICRYAYVLLPYSLPFVLTIAFHCLCSLRLLNFYASAV